MIDDYELDLEELQAPKPLTAEEQQELQDLYAEIAAQLAEINGNN